jgi:hypothetical protein
MTLNQHIDEDAKIANLRDRMSRVSDKAARRSSQSHPLSQGLRTSAAPVRTSRPVFHEPKTQLLSLIESLQS